MRFSSARASLWLAVFVVVVMVLPALSLTVGAAYTYQSNLGKIDPAVFTSPSSSATTSTASPAGGTASTSANNPTPAGFTVAVVKFKDLASPSWASRGHDFVVQSLRDVSAEAQAPVVQLVYQRGGTVLNRFWLTNALLVMADDATLRDVAQNSLVERVFPNFAITIPPEQLGHAEPAQGPYEWNIEKVGAPSAWALGITGAGVRDCVTDTGVDISHPDLVGRMFTMDSSDPFYPGGFMEFDTNGAPIESMPHDSASHGTHVSGTIAGDSMGGTAIGVAPGVWLMHGLVLPGGGGSFAQVIAGMQWCVSPFDRFGNPTPPAHVQSMSWGDTGGGLQAQLLDPIKNSLLANVIPVAAIGNEFQGTARSPGDIWGTFGIGATDINDVVAPFSSGKIIDWPSPPTSWPFFGGWPSQPYLKPDFSAPGVNVRSSIPGDGYANFDGTSMATPHVSATVSMMVQASGFSLTPEQAYNNLRNSVLDLGAPGQDDRYGWGRLDTYKAVLLSLIANTGVQGTVYDSASTAPLEGVKVTAQELGAYTTTDASGTFKMGLPEGTYSISFDKFGYISQVVGVTLILYNGTVNGYVTDGTSGPISGASVTFDKANLTVYTDAAGFYTASVKNGTYNVQANASGFVPSTQSVSVPENGTAWANFTLAAGPALTGAPAASFGRGIGPLAYVELTISLVQQPSGIVAGTVTDTGSAPVEGVQIRAIGTPVQTVTDANGAYSIELPVGTWTITATKFGYQSQQGTATVTEGQTTALDFILVPQRRVGIMYDDDQGYPLGGALDATGRFAVAQYAGNWDDLIAAVPDLDLIILSGRPFNSVFPSPDQFNSLLDAADASGVGILFLDTYYGSYAPYGIALLNQYRGDPASRSESWPCFGDVWQGGVAAHPVLRGRPVGYYTRLTNNAGCFPMSWFSGFSGTTIGDIWTGYSSADTQWGDNLAVKVTDAGSRWVLMGGYAPIFGMASFYWTSGIAEILVSASLWASTEPLQLTITPGSGVVGTHIAFSGSGAPANADLKALFDEQVVGTLVANGAGAFSGSFDLPESVFGGHTVIVQTLDENFAGERPFQVRASLVLTPSSGAPGSGVGVAGHGWPAVVFVDMSFGSTSGGRARTAADGTFASTVIVPSVRGGDYTISAVNLDTGAGASTAFRVIEQVALDVQVSVGTLHFRGEFAEVYVLVTGQGIMQAAAIEANLWSPSGTSQALTATEVAVGLYKATYTLPGNAPTGTYALVAQASVTETYLIGSGSGLATFLVSPTLTSQNNALLSIQGDIAQVRTDTGTILVDLNAVSASLTSIQGDTATISTSIGTLTANLGALDATIARIDGNVATVQTSLGTVTASLASLNTKITDIQGDVATIKTNAGNANQQLSSLQSSGGLMAMSSASVAAILSAVAAVFALAAWRAARRPKP